jgi:tricorn protease
MRKASLLLSFLAIWAFSGFAQQEAGLLRFPAIYGEQIVFSKSGDLYSAPAKGGVARKLTTYQDGQEMFAKFSPDGKNIAFTGQYDGNTEVFVIPSQGGVPQRLTYTATLRRDDVTDRMGPNNIVMTWTPDSKNVVYRSRRFTFNDFTGQLLSVSAKGGMSQEVPLVNGGFCSYSPDGKKLALNRVFREFRTWKYYQGGMADDIWIYDFATKETVNITNNVHQDIFPMWYGEEIFFLSDRDRTMNLFVYNTKSKEIQKVTNFTDYDIKFPSLGDGRIVFEKGGFIHVFDIKTRKVEKISIQVNDDVLTSRNQLKDASKFINSVGISSDGNRVVISARGDIFTVPAKSGITRNLTQSSGAHDRNASWSPDGKYIAWISDKSGEFEIYMQKSDGTEASVQLTKNADTYYYALRWSPDGKKIVWYDRYSRLRYIDINTKDIVTVAESRNDELNDYAWSPDGKWIAFSTNKNKHFQVIYLYNVETKETKPVTDDWYNSGNPEFSADGKYLYFVSLRDFNPIYSNLEWNVAYQDMSKIYLLTLQKSTPSPFAPENNEVKISEQKETPATNEGKEKGKEGEKDKTAAKPGVTVKVDFDGILNRIVALPIKAGNYWNINGLEDKVYYNVSSAGNREGTLMVYDLKKKEETEILRGGFAISADKKKMLINQQGKYSIIDLPMGKTELKQFVDLQNMSVEVNLKEEWEQIFNEAWRQMRDFFYVANMHGVDWKAMQKKYAALLPYVQQRADLTYIIGEMIGELNIGHAYVGDGDRQLPERINVGLLGAKLSKDASGYVRIDKILNSENWNPEIRNPLRDMGVDVKEGDFILAVNGKSTKDMADIYASLVNKANKQVELTVNSTANEAGSRKVIVVPVASEANLYYYDWVQKNIKKVNDATNGEVGYIHVPDMGPEGLREFMKYFYPQLYKKALIIDDRGNGGGNVSPMLIERLKREVTRANMMRNNTEPNQTPGQMILGPKVMLINNYSASDGDLFPYAFKKHKMGKVIGLRTWGGVVGIRGSLPFIDGGTLSKPEFASYSSDESQWIIEGRGVEPDILIDNDPSKEYNGIDKQLDEAIKVIKEELKNYKALPNIPAGPDKTK